MILKKYRLLWVELFALLLIFAIAVSLGPEPSQAQSPSPARDNRTVAPTGQKTPGEKTTGEKTPGEKTTGEKTADDQQPVTTLSVNVKVVTVLATVHDKHGAVINDLKKDDFTLTEDGRAQDIRYFSLDTNLPLTLGLLVDSSLSQGRVLDQERSASHSFLDQMVREDQDKAFIIHFDREVELLEDLTSSHAKLGDALNHLKTPESPRFYGNSGPGSGGGPGGGSGGGPGGGPGQGGGSPYPRSGGGGYPGPGRVPMRNPAAGTLLYDAIYLASNEVINKQSGRKALIILSDGVDFGSKEKLDSAIESAQRSNSVVYSILFKDDDAYKGGGPNGGPNRRGPNGGGFGIPGRRGPMGGGGMGGPGRFPPQHPDGKKTLERICTETGGRLFEVTKKESIDDIYSEIAQDLRNQYDLGYTPDRSGAAAAGYHKIQLTTKRKDLIVQAREGYYGAPSDSHRN